MRRSFFWSFTEVCLDKGQDDWYQNIFQESKWLFECFDSRKQTIFVRALLRWNYEGALCSALEVRNERRAFHAGVASNRGQPRIGADGLTEAFRDDVNFTDLKKHGLFGRWNTEQEPAGSSLNSPIRGRRLGVGALSTDANKPTDYKSGFILL
jgi:hypothetical protein